MTERPTVVVELAADARHASDLSAGGIFVPDCVLALDVECELVVRAASSELRLDARVVFVDVARGAALALVGFGPAIQDQLAALIAAAPPLAIGSDASIVPSELDDGDDDIAVIHSPPIHADDGAIAASAEDGDDRQRAPASVHERLRHLTLAQQLKKAHTGELHERVVLERMYGKAVWDALLRNPRVTAPEVARIARMAQLPRPLIELIVGNGAWLQVPEVRRALLANPRLGTDQILRVLRLVPKHELKLAAMQTAYSHAVRDAAKRLLKEP